MLLAALLRAMTSEQGQTEAAAYKAVERVLTGAVLQDAIEVRQQALQTPYCTYDHVIRPDSHTTSGGELGSTCLDLSPAKISEPSS